MLVKRIRLECSLIRTAIMNEVKVGNSINFRFFDPRILIHPSLIWLPTGRLLEIPDESLKVLIVPDKVLMFHEKSSKRPDPDRKRHDLFPKLHLHRKITLQKILIDFDSA